MFTSAPFRKIRINRRGLYAISLIRSARRINRSAGMTPHDRVSEINYKSCLRNSHSVDRIDRASTKMSIRRCGGSSGEFRSFRGGSFRIRTKVPISYVLGSNFVVLRRLPFLWAQNGGWLVLDGVLLVGVLISIVAFIQHGLAR